MRRRKVRSSHRTAGRLHRQLRRLLQSAALTTALSAALAGCVSAPADQSSHNVHGGAIESCGDLPPIYGDDC